MADELLAKYMEAVVSGPMRNDAGILRVKDSLKGDPASWYLAIWRYAQTMGEGDKGYLGFRMRWAWTSEDVQKYLGSEDGKKLKERIGTVSKHFQAQTGLSAYSLDHAPLERTLDKQISLWKGNWSVAKLGPQLVTKLNKMLVADKYPDPPTDASTAKFYTALRKTWLNPVANPDDPTKTYRTPTNAAPGMSDHGRLSAIDFVVKSKGKTVVSTSTAQIAKWKEKVDGRVSYAEGLKAAVTKLNGDAGTTIFDGPLAAPEEPWHYVYIPLKNMEDKKSAAPAPTD